MCQVANIMPKTKNNREEFTESSGDVNKMHYMKHASTSKKRRLLKFLHFLNYLRARLQSPMSGITHYDYHADSQNPSVV